MGCSVSKPGTNEETEATPGMRPIRRRIVDMKRRISTSTPSRKQLLPDDEEVDEHSQPNSPHDDGQKSVSSPENKGKVCPKFEKEANASESDKTTAMPIGEEKRIEVEKREREEKEYTEEEDNGENGEDEDGFGDEIAPGSPSFREYYVASVDNSMDAADTSKDEDVNDGEKKKMKKRRNESIESSEGSVTGLVKKEHKGRIFRRGLPKGGQAAVKNLLNVKSCYSPCVYVTPQENSQILNVKVPAT